MRRKAEVTFGCRLLLVVRRSGSKNLMRVEIPSHASSLMPSAHAYSDTFPPAIKNKRFKKDLKKIFSKPFAGFLLKI
jgi:hypothetical protein